MPGQHDLCQPYLDKHHIGRGWNIYAARDDMMSEVPLEDIGRAFGPIGILQYMRQMTQKPRNKRGQPPTPEQFSFAFAYFGVDPGHVIDETDAETIETDMLTEAEFDHVIARCDDQIEQDIEANKIRKGLQSELRPVFRECIDIKTVGKAIEELLRRRGAAAA